MSKNTVKKIVPPVGLESSYNGKSENFCEYLSNAYGQEIGKYLSEISEDLDLEIIEYNQDPSGYVAILTELIKMDVEMSNPNFVSAVRLLVDYFSKSWDFDSL